MARVVSLLALMGTLLFAMAAGGLLHRIPGSPAPTPTHAPHKRTFEPVWSTNYPAQFYGLPEFGWRSVFVCADANVLSLDRKNGTLVWKAVVESACQYIAAFRDVVVVGSDNAITAFDEATGAQKWTHNFTGGVAGTPARPTAVGRDKVAYTVENNQDSTPLTVLSTDDGHIIFQTAELALTRIWATDDKAVYVQAPSKSNANLSLVARSLDTWNVTWSASSFGGDAVTGGGAVAFDFHPIIAMTGAPNNAIGITVIEPRTGKQLGKTSVFTGKTNNFDYTTGEKHYFTIMSYGSPDFTNSTLSAWDYGKGDLAWSLNVTLSSPNLVPLPGWWGSYIACQGAQAIQVFDQETGELVANVEWPNPKWVIGNAMDSQFIIGNTVSGKVTAFRYE